LEGILGAQFLNAEHNLDQVKRVVQRLADMVASVQASCVDLIRRTTSKSMDQLGSDITRQVARQVADMSDGITACRMAQSNLNSGHGIMKDTLKKL
jgi:flagellar biosynthesis/type III secretory pathway protein FliH